MDTEKIGEADGSAAKEMLPKLTQIYRGMVSALPQDPRTLNILKEMERLKKSVAPIAVKVGDTSLPENFQSMTVQELTDLLTAERMAEIRRKFSMKSGDGNAADNETRDLVMQMMTKSALLAIDQNIGAEAFQASKLTPRSLKLDSLPPAIQKELEKESEIP